MKKQFAFIYIVMFSFALLISSCDFKSMINSLSGTGVNVFVDSESIAKESAEKTVATINVVFSNYNETETRNTLIENKIIIEEKIREIDQQYEESSSYEYEDVKTVIKDLIESVALPDETYQTLMYNIAKASVSQSAKDSLVKEVSKIDVNKESMIYEMYYFVMENLAHCMEIINTDKVGNSKYLLWLNDSVEATADLTPVLAEIAEPSPADLIVLSMLCKGLSDMLDITNYSSSENYVKVLSDLIDVYKCVKVFTTETNKESGLIGLINILIDSFSLSSDN